MGNRLKRFEENAWKSVQKKEGKVYGIIISKQPGRAA